MQSASEAFMYKAYMLTEAGVNMTNKEIHISKKYKKLR